MACHRAGRSAGWRRNAQRLPQQTDAVRQASAEGLLNRIANFFSGNPNSQQQVYILAQQKIQDAARRSPLLTEAQKNTTGMLDGMLHSLGFQRVTVTFGHNG